MSFKEEYDKRLRRVCGITDDTLRVTEDSEIKYGGNCVTCPYEYSVLVVVVWKAGVNENATGWSEKLVEATREFNRMSDLLNAMNEVEL
jgi:hypothetical protein